jgi:hypothetical protein
MQQPGKTFFLIPLAGAAVLLASLPVQAATFHCRTSPLAGIATAIPAQSTISTEFVDVEGTTLNIAVAENGCIQVEVSFQASTIDPYAGHLRVLVDDVAIAPAAVTFHTSASRPDNRTATFVRPSDAGGVRTIKLQFASAEGFSVTISKVVVIVRHAAEIM